MVLHDLKRPLTLEVIPSAHLLAAPDARHARRRFGPADSDPDAGLSVKYGVTSSATVEGTVNPDFSQVESDAFQVEVNQRFPLFFSEKRPFFMEGLGTFELAGVGGDAVMRTAVHTRRIVDPFWGGKTTGTAGRWASALLAAGDEAPGPPARRRARTRSSASARTSTSRRGQYSLGQSQLRGRASSPTPSSASGHNRVAGADVSLRWDKHAASATFLATRHRVAGRPRRRRTAWAARPSTPTRPSAFVVRHPGRALRPRLPDGHRVPEPGRASPRAGRYAGPELLPGREEVPLVQAHHALRLRAATARTASRAATPGSWCPACA